MAGLKRSIGAHFDTEIWKGIESPLFVKEGKLGGMKHVYGEVKWKKGKLEALRECLASCSFYL